MAEQLSLEIPTEFAAFCRDAGLSQAQVLTAFMHDLAATSLSNGSDERMHALAWFDRVIWPTDENAGA